MLKLKVDLLSRKSDCISGGGAAIAAALWEISNSRSRETGKSKNYSIVSGHCLLFAQGFVARFNGGVLRKGWGFLVKTVSN